MLILYICGLLFHRASRNVFLNCFVQLWLNVQISNYSNSWSMSNWNRFPFFNNDSFQKMETLYSVLYMLRQKILFIFLLLFHFLLLILFLDMLFLMYKILWKHLCQRSLDKTSKDFFLCTFFSFFLENCVYIFSSFIWYQVFFKT